MTAVLAEHQVDEAQACWEISEPLWGDECRFQVAERQAERDFGLAVQTCGQTRFGRECSFHLVRQLARQAAEPEQAEAVASKLGDIPRAPDAQQLFWNEWLKDQRVRGRALSAERCASLGASAKAFCTDALELQVRKLAADLPSERVCAEIDQGVLLRFDSGEPAIVAPPQLLEELIRGCSR